MKVWAHIENIAVVAGIVVLVLHGHPCWAFGLVMLVNYPDSKK